MFLKSLKQFPGILCVGRSYKDLHYIVNVVIVCRCETVLSRRGRSNLQLSGRTAPMRLTRLTGDCFGRSPSQRHKTLISARLYIVGNLLEEDVLAGKTLRAKRGQLAIDNFLTSVGWQASKDFACEHITAIFCLITQ